MDYLSGAQREDNLMRNLLAAAIAVPMLTLTAQAQEPATAEPLEVGAVAPDFALPGATRYGVLAEPIHLSDFVGKTVVLAFFYRARSRG
jgi:hypothetical protein